MYPSLNVTFIEIILVYSEAAKSTKTTKRNFWPRLLLDFGEGYSSDDETIVYWRDYVA